MDRTSDLHLDDPGSIPGGIIIIANFFCEKNAKNYNTQMKSILVIFRLKQNSKKS